MNQSNNNMKSEKEHRDRVMEVFCKTSRDFKTEKEYGDYLERAEDLIYRLINEDQERATADLKKERAKMEEELMKDAAAMSRRNENTRRKRAEEAPTWGMAYEESSLCEGVDAKRRRIYDKQDTEVGNNKKEDLNNEKVREKMKAVKIRRALGFDSTLHHERGLDELSHSIFVL